MDKAAPHYASDRDQTTVQPGAAGCVFVWENLGPTHFDRLKACRDADIPIGAIQFFARSNTYSWSQEEVAGLPVATLPPMRGFLAGWRRTVPLLRAIVRSKARHVFLCHFSDPSTILAATILRLFTRRRVWLMADSKYDDFPRTAWVERIKALILVPYHGAIVASDRSARYFASLGIRADRIVRGYDTIDLARIRRQGHAPDVAPAFAERAFVVVARLVPKKNIAAALAAYALYREEGGSPRRLAILGDGPLEEALRAQAIDLGIADGVEFAGFVQTDEVSDRLRQSLALILPSIEEQFGFVVIEAMALGVPVICSANAGAVDLMVDHGQNGFVIDPRDPPAIAAAMQALDKDEARHRTMGEAALAASRRGDASHFAEGVAILRQI